MDNPSVRAQRVQERAERAVAYWIERLADNGASFVDSEEEERFQPLAALLADLLERAVAAHDEQALAKAEAVADQIEAYAMAPEGMRIRARNAHEDMMARREETGAPLQTFQQQYERLMTLLHAAETGRVDDLGATLLEARSILLHIEDLALHG